MGTMNAYTLMVLIHHYITTQEFGVQDKNTKSKTHSDAYLFLKRQGLITGIDNEAEYDEYELTEKGTVHVQTLLNIPLPVASWKSPVQILPPA